MLRLYPELYWQILSLCPTRHRRLNRNAIFIEGMMTAQQSLAQYEDFLTEKEMEWKDLDIEELFQIEKEIAGYIRFTESDRETQRTITLNAYPWISIFKIPKEWHPWAVMQLKEKFKCEKIYPLTMVALMPCLKERGLREAPLLDVGLRILKMLQERSMSYEELQDGIVSTFCLENENAKACARLHVLHEVKGLLKHGIIIMKKED